MSFYRLVYLVFFVSLFCVSCSKTPSETLKSWGSSLGLSNELEEDPIDQTLNLKDRSAIRKYYDRGQYIVTSVSACGICHGSRPKDPTSPLSGGREVYGIKASNITSDNQTGVGLWSVKELVNSIRFNKSKDGSVIRKGVHANYSWLSDFDTKAIVTFLLASEPVKKRISKESSKWDLDIFSSSAKVKGYIPQYTPSATEQYGRYLTHNVAGCVSCHSSSLEQDDLFSGKDYGGSFPIGGPDIREIKDIQSFLSKGKKSNGNKVDPYICPQEYFKNMTNVDKQAIELYLKKF